MSESPLTLCCPTSLTSFFVWGGSCQQNILECLEKSYSTSKHFDERSYKSCLLMDFTKLQQPWTLVKAKSGQGEQKAHHGLGMGNEGEGALISLCLGTNFSLQVNYHRVKEVILLGGSGTATRKEIFLLVEPLAKIHKSMNDEG